MSSYHYLSCSANVIIENGIKQKPSQGQAHGRAMPQTSMDYMITLYPFRKGNRKPWLQLPERHMTLHYICYLSKYYPSKYQVIVSTTVCLLLIVEPGFPEQLAKPWVREPGKHPQSGPFTHLPCQFSFTGFVKLLRS